MKERPILFSAPMVRAILDGTKTMTRRVVKQPIPADAQFVEYGPPDHISERHRDVVHWFVSADGDLWPSNDSDNFRCPYGQPGDRLWVRETFLIDHYKHVDGPLPKTRPRDVYDHALYFRADGSCCEQFEQCPCGEGQPPAWRPSIYMPRWASRITLDVVSVRVERLQDISEEDARAEGVVAVNDPEGDCWTDGTHRTAFEFLWGQINGFDGEPKARAPWASNPWVWRVEFKRIEVPHG